MADPALVTHACHGYGYARDLSTLTSPSAGPLVLALREGQRCPHCRKRANRKRGKHRG